MGTAAAGGRLSEVWGGRWDGAQTRVPVTFGIDRPARTIAFARSGTLAGFAFETLIVRLSDFGGADPLPSDPVDPRDIVISHHLARQHAWPAVVIASDRLSRCAELVYAAQPRTLTLHCAFDAP